MTTTNHAEQEETEGWTLTLGCVLAVMTPMLGLLVFLTLRAIIGEENFTALGYVALCPVSQMIGATIVFLAGYSSYDLSERQKLGNPVFLQAAFTVFLIAVPIFLAVRGLVGEAVISPVGYAALILGSLMVGVVALTLFVRAGAD